MSNSSQKFIKLILKIVQLKISDICLFASTEKMHKCEPWISVYGFFSYIFIQCYVTSM